MEIMMFCARLVNFPFNRLRRAWNRLRMRRFAPEEMNRYPTVICNDCTGGMILHDLRMPFNSPFINVCLSDEDYLKLLADPRMYMGMELTDDTKGCRYPIGLLGDIRIHFMHCDSFEHAKEAWLRRLVRMNYDNVVVIGSCIDANIKDLGARFNELQYDHKILLHNDMAIQVPCSVYIKGFTAEKNRLLIDYQGWLGKRGYDQVDWVDFFRNILVGPHNSDC